MIPPITITDNLVENIISNQDINESEIYIVATSESFDPYVPALAIELECDEDCVTQQSERDIEDTKAFHDGLRAFFQDLAENELYTVYSLWRHGPATLYREIRLDIGPLHLKDALKKNLGESWTPDPMKAISYMNESGKYGYTLEAIVPYSSVNWESTIIRRCNLAIGADEDEVTLLDGSPVKLTGITFEDGKKVDFAGWLDENATV